MRTSPSNARSPIRMRFRVDLPDPFGPMSATLRPAGMVHVTSRWSGTLGLFSDRLVNVVLPITVADAPDCAVELIRADLDAAYAGLEAALDEIGGVVAAEDNFPAVGALFADRVEISCPE